MKPPPSLPQAAARIPGRRPFCIWGDDAPVRGPPGRFGDVALSVRVSIGIRFFGPRGGPGRFGDVAPGVRQPGAWRHVPEASGAVTGRFFCGRQPRHLVAPLSSEGMPLLAVELADNRTFCPAVAKTRDYPQTAGGCEAVFGPVSLPNPEESRVMSALQSGLREESPVLSSTGQNGRFFAQAARRPAFAQAARRPAFAQAARRPAFARAARRPAFARAACRPAFTWSMP